MSRHQTLAVWGPRLLAALATTHSGAKSTLRTLLANLAWMLRFLEQRGARIWPDVTEALLREWYWAPTQGANGSWRDPAVSTAKNRQWAARVGLRLASEMGARVDPAVTGERIKPQSEPSSSSARPLTDEQLHRVCAYADDGPPTSTRPLLIAFSRSGASAAEAAAVRASDIDLDSRTITLRGDSARVCRLDDWSAQAIARYLRLNASGPEDLLCVRADTPTDRAARSVNARLWRIINQAGLAGLDGVSGRSIRLTAARWALERDGLEAAARLLGSPSLDNTATALGYRWQQRYGLSAQPGTGDG